MPFFHDQDRSGLRRLYVEAWRKHRAGSPLEPLEHQIVTVIEQHPEYHALLEDQADALGRDFAPEAGQSNPFLHMGLHLAIREQSATDRPAGIAAIRAQLVERLADPHEATFRTGQLVEIDVRGRNVAGTRVAGRPTAPGAARPVGSTRTGP